MSKSFHRIVTGHSPDGVSILHSRTELHPQPIPSGDAEFALVWTTPTVPADMTDDKDLTPVEAGLTLKGGSVIRLVDMLPGQSSPMHRSYSIDYGIVLSGDLELVLDGGEVISLTAGDIVVQRATNHLWRNPSQDTACRIVFVLTEALPIVVNGKQLDEVHP